jgi:hypothetical protein
LEAQITAPTTTRSRLNAVRVHTVHHVYLMTYQTYKDELTCLTHIERDLKFAVLAMWDVLSEEQQEAFWSFEGYKALEHSSALAVLRFQRDNARISQDVRKIRKYRSALAYWFWFSRIGNPPVLR